MPAPKGNKYALGNNGGRPRKFESVADVYEQGTIYINETLASDRPLTFTGLCLALGLDKSTYNDYANGKYDNSAEVFSLPLKELKQRIENYAESKLFANNPTGAIFALKNYGWTDRQEIDQKITGEISIDLPSDERKKRIDELLSKRSDK